MCAHTLCVCMCVCESVCVSACVCVRAEGHEHEDANLNPACSVFFAGHFGVIEKELVP